MVDPTSLLASKDERIAELERERNRLAALLGTVSNALAIAESALATAKRDGMLEAARECEVWAFSILDPTNEQTHDSRFVERMVDDILLNVATAIRTRAASLTGGEGAALTEEQRFERMTEEELLAGLEPLVAPLRTTYRIDHDGFEGTVIGRYVTREGKRGAVLQQAGTKVVHVYGEKWLIPLPADAPHTTTIGDG